MHPISETICLQRSTTTAGVDNLQARKLYHLVILVGCVTVLAASFILQPHEDGLSLFGLGWPFSCWLHETFGVNCALCGMSRSFCSLAHGDWRAGLAFHGLGPALFAFFCLQIPYRAYALAIHPGTLGAGWVKAHAAMAALLCAAIMCHWFVYLEGLIV